jgi:hypothetical protein
MRRGDTRPLEFAIRTTGSRTSSCSSCYDQLALVDQGRLLSQRISTARAGFLDFEMRSYAHQKRRRGSLTPSLRTPVTLPCRASQAGSGNVGSTLGQDHRHPVVNVCHELVGGCVAMAQVGQASSLLAMPHGPDASEAEGTSRPEFDEERRPAASVVLSPLVEAVDYDKAAMASEGVPEHRRGGQGLGPCVDRRELRLLSRGRDEAPANSPRRFSPWDRDDGLDDLALLEDLALDGEAHRVEVVYGQQEFRVLAFLHSHACKDDRT